MMLMLQVIAALLMAQTSAAPIEFADFDRYCSTLDGASAMDGRLRAGGWIQFDAGPATELARLVDAIQEVPSRDFKVSTAVYRIPNTRGPVILVSQMRAPDGSGSIECKHIDETAPVPSTAALQNWAGRKPDVTSNKNRAMTWAWRPGRGEAHMTAVVYVDPASKPRFPGVGLIATSVRYL